MIGLFSRFLNICFDIRVLVISSFRMSYSADCIVDELLRYLAISGLFFEVLTFFHLALAPCLGVSRLLREKFLNRLDELYSMTIDSGGPPAHGLYSELCNILALRGLIDDGEVN